MRVVALLLLLLTGVAARAEPAPLRVYLLHGLGDGAFSQGIDEIAERLRRTVPSAAIQVGAWHEWEMMAADAARHPGDRLVVIGFSVGSKSAGLMANRLAAQGLHIKVIGLDPMCAQPAVNADPRINAVNFYRTRCGTEADGRMAGARNVPVGNTAGADLGDHIAFTRDPQVQALAIAEALRDAPPRSRRAGLTMP